MSDTQKLVPLNRLKTLLDAYGSMPDCWPAEERPAAMALTETSPEARRMVAQAAALDSLLDKIPEPEVSAALTSRVRSMALPAADRKPSGLFNRLAEYLRPGSSFGFQGAVAMAGVLGMVVGIGVSPMVFDRAAPLERVVATSAALPAPAPIVAALPVIANDRTDTASLAPNPDNISLMGDDVTVSLSGRTGDTLVADDGGTVEIALGCATVLI